MVTASSSQSDNDRSAANSVKLDVKNLSISYGGRTVLEDVSLAIHEHEIFGIIGPANAGKTSLLKAINRIRFLRFPEPQGKQLLSCLQAQHFSSRSCRRVYSTRRWHCPCTFLLPRHRFPECRSMFPTA